jgi:hypothetical protein
LGRIIRVDHAANYKPPKDSDEADELTKFLREEGCHVDVIAEKKDKIERITDSKSQIKQEPDRKHKYDNGNDKYKDRDRERDREREHDRDREREKDRDRHRDSSHKKEKKRRSRSRTRSPRSHHHDDKNYKKSHRY